MKKLTYLLLVLMSAMVLPACTSTFAGSILVLRFGDIIWYVLLAFLFAVVIAFMSNRESRRTRFWLWFILSLILTPLAGFIYLIVLFTRRREE